MIRILAAVATLLAGTALIAGCGSDAPEGAKSNTTAVADISPERVKDFGDYELHFNAWTTDQLPQDVADKYRIVRSKSRAMLNVVVLKKVPGTTGHAVEADLVVKTTNLVGQPKSLTLRQIKDGQAIYYIGDLPVVDKETLIFAISASPRGHSQAFNHKFKMQFFVD